MKKVLAAIALLSMGIMVAYADDQVNGQQKISLAGSVLRNILNISSFDKDYAGRAQVSEALILASWQKIYVAEHFAEYKRCPDNMLDDKSLTGIAKPTMLSSEYVEQIIVTGDNKSCTITATLRQEGVDKNIAGKSLTLMMIPQKDGIFSWTCSSMIDNQYLPSTCQH